MTSRKRKFKRLVVFAWTSLFFVILSSTQEDARWGAADVYAQSATATLSGTVFDETGAVVPAVRVSVLNLDNVLQRHATTNDEGFYTIPLLPPGRYNLTAQRDGFSTVEIRNLRLNVGDQLALKVKLKVGEIGEFVTVTEKPASVQASASVGTIINRQFVENLPLNGRSFQSLFELTPGVVLTRARYNEQGQFSANGQRPNANYFTVDGVSANIGVSAGASPNQAAAGTLPALTALGGTNNLVSVDALQEFRILTSSYAPEFGRTPGAQVSIITRAGTNELRGSVFNYFRHDKLDANDFFANSRGLRKPAIRQNDFGATLGGSLIKDRLFFFASYEGLRLRQPQVAVSEVPSNFARRSAPEAIQAFLNAFPVPNGRDVGNGLAEFAASYSDPSSLDATSLRIDARANDRLTFFARFNHAPSDTAQRGSVIAPGFSAPNPVSPTISQSLNTLTFASFLTQTLTAGANHIVSPRVVNDFRINWSRAGGATSFKLDDFGGAAPLPAALLSPVLSPGDAGFQFLLPGGTNPALSAGKNADNLQRQINVIDNLSFVTGTHALKFGIDFRRLAPVYDPLQYNQSIVYGAAGAASPSNALRIEILSGASRRVPVFLNFSAYAQDAWQATSRLTLNYGLRWELNPPPSEANGNDAFTAVNLNDPATLALAPRGTPLWRTTYNNFAPRFGAVYQLARRANRELVLRGGVGLFYDLGNGQAAQGFGSVFPFVAVRRLTNVPLPLDESQAAPPPLDLAPPYGTIVAFDPRLKLPLSMQWNAAIDQSLGSNQTLTASYVGALGRRLLREDALVNPNPNFTVVRVTRNAARSDYHALQLQFARRLSRGVQALASYTWSKATDTASSDSLSRLRGVGTAMPPPSSISRDIQNTERGPSDFDVRHTFTGAITYNLPVPFESNASLRAVLRDWSIDLFFRARTATPVNVITRTDALGEGLIVELRRPDLIAGVPLYLNDPQVAGGRRINRAAFREPLENRQGTLPYNHLRGFAFSQLDVALRREFRLGEQLRLQLRAELFNVLNHPNFANPNNDLSSESFGRSTQTFARGLGAGGINGGLSPLYQIGGPRSIQLAIKLQF